MCSQYKVNGQWCENVGELISVLGEAAVCCLPSTCQIYGDEDCLCGINLQKLADGTGQIIASDGCDWYMGDHVAELQKDRLIPSMTIYPRPTEEIHNGNV